MASSLELSLVFAQPMPPLSINRANRMHWAKRHAHHSTWRDATYFHAKRERIPAIKASGLIDVEIRFGTTQPGKRRDPHNYFLTVKAICDGLTLAGVWEDDDSRHVSTREPLFGDINPDLVMIVLRWSE